jgi:hypothetical protein
MNNVSCQYTGVHNVVFPTFEEATDILNAMRSICASYGYVTVMDFKDLIDVDSSFRDSKYRWGKENLSVARIVERDNGFVIDILPAMYCEDAQYTKADLVNHPAHYKSKTGLETIDVIDAFTADLTGTEAVCTANVIKYICRWKHKNGLQDLEKAKWYLEHLINYMKKEND